jgi:hypothetical protein
VNHWTRPERRARDALLGALLPATTRADGRRVPGYAERPDGAFWVVFACAAPRWLQWGLRAAVLCLWVSLWLHGRRLARLSPDSRAAAVARFAASRWYSLRQVALALKTVACLRHFSDPEVRRALDAPRGEGPEAPP